MSTTPTPTPERAVLPGIMACLAAVAIEFVGDPVGDTATEAANEIARLRNAIERIGGWATGIDMQDGEDRIAYSARLSLRFSTIRGVCAAALRAPAAQAPSS